MTQPQPLDAERIAAQLGAAYLALNPAERARALWIVTICAADSPGALSLIAGTLAAHRLDIVAGDLFTLRSAGSPNDAPPPAPGPHARLPARPPARVLLDRFELRPVPDAESAEHSEEHWRAIEHDLAEAFARLAAGEGDAARDLVIDRVSRTLASAAGPAAAVTLLPVSIDVDSDDAAETTRLTIRAPTRVVSSSSSRTPSRCSRSPSSAPPSAPRTARRTTPSGSRAATAPGSRTPRASTSCAPPPC